MRGGDIIEKTDLKAKYADMLQSDNPARWLITQYGDGARDLIARGLLRTDPLYEITVNNALRDPDLWTAMKIFTEITGYSPLENPAPPGAAAVDTAALQGQFDGIYTSLQSDLVRLRAYELWDDLTPGERTESLLYVRVKITGLRGIQKRLRSPENDGLIAMLESDLGVIARRDMAKPPNKAAPSMEEVVSLLASLNDLQLKGIMKMYAIPPHGGDKAWQSIVHFLNNAESPVRRYAIREHASRIITIRKKAK